MATFVVVDGASMILDRHSIRKHGVGQR
jgi:hypothetical protein